MGVEAREDLRDLAEVPVHELAKTPVVVDGAGSGATRYEELEVRDAEGVLDVDRQETEAVRVLGGPGEPVLVGPRRGVACPLLVRHPPHLADPTRVKVRRERELTHQSLHEFGAQLPAKPAPRTR